VALEVVEELSLSWGEVKGVLSKIEGFVKRFSFESSADVPSSIRPVEGTSDKTLVFNRNSGDEEQSDVFGNRVLLVEVILWNGEWDSSTDTSEEVFDILEDKEPLEGMVESWTGEVISNGGKSNFIEVNVMFNGAMFLGSHATVGDSD